MAVSNVHHHLQCTRCQLGYRVVCPATGNLIRAFGLDINTDTNKITQVVVLNPNYRIYPGQIDINVYRLILINYGTPIGDPCDILGQSQDSIQMASLLRWVRCTLWTPTTFGDANAGYGMKPEANGVLLKFYVGGDCNYLINENAIRGGIVMEDPTEEPNVTLCSGHVGVVVVYIGLWRCE